MHSAAAANAPFGVFPPRFRLGGREGEATFKFHTKGKSGALSRDEPYTVIRIGGLQVP